MHLHKQLLRFIVIIGVFTQILWSMDHREKSKNDLYQAIVDGNVGRLRTAITNIDAFNPNDNYTVKGYKLPDGRLFLPSSNVEGFEKKDCIERTFSPFRMACENNQLAVVRLLVEEYGASVNAGEQESWALRLSVNKMNVEMVHYLLSKGAKISQDRIDEIKRFAVNNPQVSRHRELQRIIYALEGYKVIGGFPLTPVNIGIIVAIATLGVTAGVWFYKRCYADESNDTLDTDEEHDASVSDSGVGQIVERA